MLVSPLMSDALLDVGFLDHQLVRRKLDITLAFLLCLRLLEFGLLPSSLRLSGAQPGFNLEFVLFFLPM